MRVGSNGAQVDAYIDRVLAGIKHLLDNIVTQGLKYGLTLTLSVNDDIRNVIVGERMVLEN
jgi:hypothetical protein